ncbi:MAG: HNH endonuclease family protein [Acidimicrobiales bacterium]
MNRPRTGTRRAVLILAVLAVAALHVARTQPDPDPGTTQAPGGPAVEQLATLPVTAETGADGYERDRFGTGWAAAPEGCDTRTAVLVDEALTPPTVEGCTVVAGEWVSTYDGARVTDPAGLDVDHLVPLAEAWTSGAHRWTDQQRRAFANDLDPGRPDALIAVTASANGTKGDGDPAEWLPPDRARHCWYATAWVTQKAAWHLAVDEAEHQALADAVAGCPPDQGATP